MSRTRVREKCKLYQVQNILWAKYIRCKIYEETVIIEWEILTSERKIMWEEVKGAGKCAGRCIFYRDCTIVRGSGPFTLHIAFPLKRSTTEVASNKKNTGLRRQLYEPRILYND